MKGCSYDCSNPATQYAESSEGTVLAYACDEHAHQIAVEFPDEDIRPVREVRA